MDLDFKISEHEPEITETPNLGPESESKGGSGDTGKTIVTLLLLAGITIITIIAANKDAQKLILRRIKTSIDKIKEKKKKVF